MMNKKKLLVLAFLLLLYMPLASQTNNSLSSSPYSLYGLGSKNHTTTGKINTLGGLGFAFKTATEINLLNPASYAYIGEDSFFFDLGIRAQTETILDTENANREITANFSTIAFAFALNKKSGIGFSLSPYTNVGYNLYGKVSNIEGTSNTYTTDAFGEGGLNDVKINYGYLIHKDVSLGISASYLFGKITQTEVNYFQDNILQIEDANYYSGLSLGIGLQYQYSPKLSFGSVINLPVSLKGNQTSTVSQVYADAEVYDNDLDDFKLPLEIGIGFINTINETFTLNVDYKRSFWTDTNQSDYFGSYTDQDSFGFGLEYQSQKSNLKYSNTIEYRTGFNFDNGNLLINNTRIKNYNYNLGLGLPLSKNSGSMLNVNYSYGIRGKASNTLVKETYHLLSLNFSFEGIWFQQRKLN